MRRTEVEAGLINVVRQIQEMSGRPESPISGQTCLIGGLVGFDSLNCAEAAVMFGDQVGCELDPSVLIGSGSKHPSITEIVDLICQADSIQGKAA